MHRRDRAIAWLYERTGGRLAGHPVLRTTTGRRSDLPRRTPVGYENVGGHVSVRIGPSTVAAEAKTLGAAGRERVRARARRELPVVRQRLGAEEPATPDGALAA